MKRVRGQYGLGVTVRGSQRTDRGGASQGGSTHTTAAKSAPSEIGALVPSWRLAEEAGKRRELEARVRELEARNAELEAIQRSHRQEWVFRRGKAAG
jgi:hypothetical protein